MCAGRRERGVPGAHGNLRRGGGSRPRLQPRVRPEYRRLNFSTAPVLSITRLLPV